MESVSSSGERWFEDESSTEEISENESALEVSKRNGIRKKLSTMSFEDLQKLREKMGSKKYNDVVFGAAKKKQQTTFKRVNKNRPREMSSKRRFHPTEQNAKRNAPRDPRFDPLCGTYNEKEFKTNYKFLKGVRVEERAKLAGEYKMENDPKQQQKIKFLMQRLDNQIREEEKREKEKEHRADEKRQIKGQLMKGEKPAYKKKSEKRITALVHQYEELKSCNRLKKHLERRSKKLASKERKRNA